MVLPNTVALVHLQQCMHVQCLSGRSADSVQILYLAWLLPDRAIMSLIYDRTVCLGFSLLFLLAVSFRLC